MKEWSNEGYASTAGEEKLVVSTRKVRETINEELSMQILSFDGQEVLEKAIEPTQILQLPKDQWKARVIYAVTAAEPALALKEDTAEEITYSLGP